METRQFFNQYSKVSCCSFHIQSSLLVVGFTSGVFGLYELPDFTNIHTLRFFLVLLHHPNHLLFFIYFIYLLVKNLNSISKSSITNISINKTGEWLGFVIKSASGQINGHVIVWEWQAQTYILKQQGIGSGLGDLRVCYGNDSSIVASGGQDSKVRLWNTQSGSCFVTFDQHTGPITGN